MYIRYRQHSNHRGKKETHKENMSSKMEPVLIWMLTLNVFKLAQGFLSVSNSCFLVIFYIRNFILNSKFCHCNLGLWSVPSAPYLNSLVQWEVKHTLLKLSGMIFIQRVFGAASHLCLRTFYTSGPEYEKNLFLWTLLINDIYVGSMSVWNMTCLFWQAKWCSVSLQVGDRDDSNVYISMKLKAAAEVKWFVSDIQGNVFYEVYLPWQYCILRPFVMTSGLNTYFYLYADWNKCHTHETPQYSNRGGGKKEFELV